MPSATNPANPTPVRHTVWIGFRVEPAGTPYLFDPKDAFEVQLARLLSVAASSRVTQLVSVDRAAFEEAGFAQEALLELEFLDEKLVSARPAAKNLRAGI